MPDEIKVTIDASGLNRGLALANQWTKRTPAQSCNQAALEVSLAAQKATPFVTPEVVDRELAIIATPIIGKRGKPTKKKYLKAFKTVDNPEVPLAALIVAARANPNSHYNELTASRYKLPSNPFKGVPRAVGRWLMKSLIDRMGKARHSSGHYLQAGWVKAIRGLLRSDRGRKYGGSGNAGVKPTGGNWENLGDVKPAQAGQPVAYAMIENSVGGEGANFESHNRALNQYGGPALQHALDNEGAKQMEYFLKKSGQEELANPVNKEWG